MKLTEFGQAVREARIKVGESLRSMAKELDASPSYLSGIETGAKNVSTVWISKISEFFEKRDYKIEKLQELADISNKHVHLNDDLCYQQKMLISGFANSEFTPEQLKVVADILENMKNDKVDNDE